MSQPIPNEGEFQQAIENMITESLMALYPFHTLHRVEVEENHTTIPDTGTQATTFTGIVLQYDHPAPDGTAAVPRTLMMVQNAPTRRTALMMLIDGLSMLLGQAQDRGSENMPWAATLATAAAQVQAARAAAAAQAHAANPRPHLVVRPFERSHTDRARSLRRGLRRMSSPEEYLGRVPGDVYGNQPAEDGGNQPPGDVDKQPSEGGGNQPSDGGGD